MADTAVATTNVVSLTKNVAVAPASGQAVTVGNTAVITPAAGSLSGQGVGTKAQSFKGRYVLIVMTESGSVSTSVATVKAGPTGGTPANQAAKGDLANVTFTSGQTKYLQVEASRFLQANGTIRVAVSGTGASVTFSAYLLDPSA